MDELRRKGEDRHMPTFKNVLKGRRRLTEGTIPRAEDFSPEIQRILKEIAEAKQKYSNAMLSGSRASPIL